MALLKKKTKKQNKNSNRLGVEAHTYNPPLRRQPDLQNEFHDNQGARGPVSKKKKTEQMKKTSKRQ